MIETKSSDTAEFTTDTGVHGLPAARSQSTRVDVDLGAESNTGKIRPNNEDHYLVVRFDRALQILLTNMPAGAVPVISGETGYGLLVADGMGGAAAGEIASREAISTLVQLVLDTPDWIMKHEGPFADEVLKRCAQRLREVNEALRAKARSEPRLAGMGTTMTMAASVGFNLFVAHVGDSRAYLFRKGELKRLTHDQTMAQALVDAGAVSPEVAATHPMRHVLTSVLGQKTDLLTTEVRRYTLQDGDTILLCTDGLTDMVDDAAIAKVLAGPGLAGDFCRRLVGDALDHGGKDNVTVAVARYRIPAA